MRRVHVCSRPGCPNLEPCPRHSRPRNASWSEDRDTVEQGRFRARVMRRAGGWCERCGKAPATQAHHIRPGYEPAHGIAVCDACHQALDDKARKRGVSSA